MDWDPNEIHHLRMMGARKQARKEALEEAALICDALRHPYHSAETDDWINGTEACADAIRERIKE